MSAAFSFPQQAAALCEPDGAWEPGRPGLSDSPKDRIAVQSDAYKQPEHGEGAGGSFLERRVNTQQEEAAAPRDTGRLGSGPWPQHSSEREEAEARPPGEPVGRPFSGESKTVLYGGRRRANSPGPWLSEGRCPWPPLPGSSFQGLYPESAALGGRGVRG